MNKGHGAEMSPPVDLGGSFWLSTPGTQTSRWTLNDPRCRIAVIARDWFPCCCAGCGSHEEQHAVFTSKDKRTDSLPTGW